MVGKKMNKVLGAHDKCFCGTAVICVEKEYKGEKRLSWVNEDGSSHYSRADDGSFSCNSTIVEDPKNKRVEPSPTTNNSTLFPPKGENYIIKDFFSAYRQGYVEAEKFTKEVIFFGAQPTDAEIRISSQCIMKSYMPYWSKKND